MDPGPLTDVVTIEAHGDLWRIMDPKQAAFVNQDPRCQPEPVLSTGEVRALELQMERWSAHHPKHPAVRTLSPEMTRAVAAVKRVFRMGDERALIEDWGETPRRSAPRGTRRRYGQRHR